MTQVSEIQRYGDRDGYFLHFNGGVRAAQIDYGVWQLEPVLDGNKPCRFGPLTTTRLQKILGSSGLKRISIQEFGWRNGEYYSIWTPIVYEARISPCAADLWANVSNNLGNDRIKSLHESGTQTELASILDNKSPPEALSRHISLSLRNLDLSIEQITETYYEQLVDHLSSGMTSGQIRSAPGDQRLYAHIHSFFVHLGSARDYLAAFIANQIGWDHTKTDSMTRLMEKLRRSRLPNDPVLQLLLSMGYLQPHPKKNDQFQTRRWNKVAGEVRNELVHKRAYGSLHEERFGSIKQLSSNPDLFRYFRPMYANGKKHQDALDFILHHYQKLNELMHRAAMAAGHNLQPITLKAVKDLRVL